MSNIINLVRNDSKIIIEPYQNRYDVDISSEKRLLADRSALEILRYLSSEEYSKKFVSHVFQYKIRKLSGLVSSFRTFFRCVLHDPIKLCCSPQYGTALWAETLGFFETPNKVLVDTPEYFFEDYVLETTTFVRFHTDYYYNHLFNANFRIMLARNCIKELLIVGQEHNQIHLVSNAITCAIQLQCFQ